MKYIKKKECYFSEEANLKKKDPAPNAYSAADHLDWNKPTLSKCCRQPGKFLKDKRLTMTEEVIKRKSVVPGSN
jgi:hypothetical protein